MMEDIARPDLGDYCRRIEDHLTRANAGHLVRIVGPGFELVRGWAESGVPLSVVFRGIDLKTERHKDGAAKRPLRIEFCAGDVRAVFDQWRRAVGVSVFDGAGETEANPGEVSGEAHDEGGDQAPRRRPLGRHLDRAIDRLSRAAARLDMPEGLKAECSRIIDVLATMRETSAKARGAARDEAAAALAGLDADLSRAARGFAPADWMGGIRAEASADLSPFRARLPPQAWETSMEVTVDRLLRDRFSLPALQL